MSIPHTSVDSTHTDPAFTLRTYTHVFQKSRREADDKMGAVLAGAL